MQKYTYNTQIHNILGELGPLDHMYNTEKRAPCALHKREVLNEINCVLANSNALMFRFTK